MSLRQRAGAILYDVPRFAASLVANRWIRMHNRNESVSADGRGVKCKWEFTSDLHVAKVFPVAGALLMRAAFAHWPIRLRDEPERSASPEVAFVLGHRGLERLPHLLTTLRSIAGQKDSSVEAIVVEQDRTPRIGEKLPPWVRYVFTQCETSFNRSAALNAGVAAAKAGIVVLHDNDLIVPSSYAFECAARVAEGYSFLELKRFTFYLSEDDTKEIFDRGTVRTDRPSTIVQNLLGASIAARRDAYRAAGQFDEEFVGWGGEDNEFWERAEATARTYRFGYLPFLHLHHAPQKEKGDPNAPAVRRYQDLRGIPPSERIERLNARRRQAGR
jgi:hypothetical protein